MQEYKSDAMLEGNKTYALDQFSFYLQVGEAEQNYYMGVPVEEYNPGKVLVEEGKAVEEEEVMPMEMSLSHLPKNRYYYA